VATVECALQSEATLGLFVWNSFGPVKFGQSGFDFGKKHEPFNDIIDGGVWWHCLERFNNAITSKWLLHGFDCNAHLAASEASVSSTPEFPTVGKFENRLLGPTNYQFSF